MTNHGDFWKRKLLAFLHDPPSKPLDIPGHELVAESIRRRAGFDPETEVVRDFARVCDFTAAAADRFPFPRPGVLRSSFSGTRGADPGRPGTPFHHPLGGSDLYFDRPFPSDDFAEEVLQDVQPGGEYVLGRFDRTERDRINFFLHWRKWPEDAGRKDERTLFLPADTRIPDHNVWCHNAVVSALQGCVEEARLRPAFLLFQFGPVQEFISQARSTRDLWSGSYLLSWLAAHAIKAVTDEIGPDAVIFPALRGQPIYDLLHKEEIFDRIGFRSGEGATEETLWRRMGLSHEKMLTPNFPNRFLALVPADRGEELAQTAERALLEEFTRIADRVWDWLLRCEAPAKPDWRERFGRQIRAFPRITWQVCPWEGEDVSSALSAFKRLSPAGSESGDREPPRGLSPAENLSAAHRLAVETVPLNDRDGRYFKDETSKSRLNNPGFCWSYYYALAAWLLAARRRTRDFEAWPTDPTLAGTPKDSFSGVEEVIGGERWWDDLRRSYPFYFRSRDRLGALNLVKRLWHKAYLEKEPWKLDVKRNLRFESVPGVAAGRWRDRLLDLVERDPDAWHALLRFAELLNRPEVAALVEDRGLVVSSTTHESDWLRRTDPGCFQTGPWTVERNHPAAETAAVVIEGQRRLFKHEGIGRVGAPPVYYAVIAFDGDEMGKWVGGDNTPALLSQMSSAAREYFERLGVAGIQDLRRPLGPSYHLQFSEALTNFSLHLARPAVEHFGGELIYAGGDDVLAMVPAETALDCAEALLAAFRGRPELERLAPDIFEVLGDEGGYVRLRHATGAREESPTWPLIVPGPNAWASCGVAVGHIRSPLQDLIAAAREAERRAKHELGRKACAVALYKRSGEIVRWGFKWRSGALPLYRRFVELSSGAEPVLSSRFGYALQELLRRYSPPAQGPAPVVAPVEDLPLRTVVDHELRHVADRQWRRNGREGETARAGFLDLCAAYLDSLGSDRRPLIEDFPRLFDTANFMMRGGE